MNLFEGKLSAKGLKIAVVISKFNSMIGERLLDGAKDAFYQLDGDESKMDVFKVPGSYEIPGVARRLYDNGDYDAIVCLGVIIRGQTPHFDFVASNTAKGIMELSSEGEIPVIFGIVTTDDMEQAIDRAGLKVGNKGYDAVMSAVETANLYQQIQ